MDTLAFSVPRIKSGTELIALTGAVRAGSSSMETVSVLTILSGIRSAAFLVPVEKSGIHFQGPAHARPILSGMDYHALPATAEDSMTPTPKTVFVQSDQTGMASPVHKPVLIHSSGI
jgi:hypothetical protein